MSRSTNTDLAIVLGTGPSLAAQVHEIRELRERGCSVFGVNNTFEDFDLDVWIACDPQWHHHYGPVELAGVDQWHWDREICDLYGYRYIEGIWYDGLWMDDPYKIAYNHCSSAQALNLAANQYRCNPILLAGHDFHYRGKRHYFSGLSDEDGEYPERLRKHSTFDGLIETYRHIGEQAGLPRIINCTPGSSLPWFELGSLSDWG